MTKTILAVLLGTLVPSLAIASPRWSKPLDPDVKASALTEVELIAQKQGASPEIAKLLMSKEVVATSSDTGCPGIDVDIVNATAQIQWNVEVTIEQKDGPKQRKDKLHLPFMPPDTQTRVTVSCMQDYTTRSRYAITPSEPISMIYDAKGTRTLAEAIPAMAKEPIDFLARGREVTTTTPDASGRTMLDDLLDTNDPDVIHEVVMGIARSGLGAKELGEALERNGTGALASEVATSMSKLPPAQQAGLARTLLGSTIAEQWIKDLEPLIDGRLCNGPRPDVMALWLRAQNDEDIPVEKLRTHVREKCKLVKGDGPALVAALELDPSRASALDKVDADVFAGAVATWKVATKKVSASQVAFMRHTGDVKRFGDAAAVVQPITMVLAIEAVAEAPVNDATGAKAVWLETGLTKLVPDVLDDTVAELFTKLVNGAIVAPALRDATRATRSHAATAADTALQAYAREHSMVFDTEKLAAANVDVPDFLVFTTASLDDCGGSLTKLEDCAKAIAAYPARAGTAVLSKVAADAVLGSFAKSIDDLTRPLEHHRLAEIAKLLHAAGLPLKQDRICGLVEQALRNDRDLEETIADVEQIDPTAPCIASARAEAKARGHKAVWMTIAALFGLFGPLPLGFWWIRRKWRKVKSALPVSACAAIGTGANLEDRLGAKGLGRALGVAIAEARRELATTPARRGLDELDDAMLERVAATTRRAVKSGDAASQLVRRGTDAVYIVALPMRQVRPQLVQRYLGAPWPEHLAAVRSAAGVPVLALIVLCGPDAAEATLLVGYGDGSRSSDPDALLDAREARERGANPFRHVMALASETTAAPAKAA